MEERERGKEESGKEKRGKWGRKKRKERKDHYSVGSPPTDFILNIKQVSEDDIFVYQ